MYVPSEVTLEKRDVRIRGFHIFFFVYGLLVFLIGFILYVCLVISGWRAKRRARRKSATETEVDGTVQATTNASGSTIPHTNDAVELVETPPVNNNDSTEREVLPDLATPNQSPTPSMYLEAHSEFIPEYTERSLPAMPPPVYAKEEVC